MSQRGKAFPVTLGSNGQPRYGTYQAPGKGPDVHDLAKAWDKQTPAKRPKSGRSAGTRSR